MSSGESLNLLKRSILLITLDKISLEPLAENAQYAKHVVSNEAVLLLYTCICEGSSNIIIIFTYRNLPIKGTSPNKGAPLVWRDPML